MLGSVRGGASRAPFGGPADDLHPFGTAIAVSAAVSGMTRDDFDRLLLASDPAQAVRDALANGSLATLIPELRREVD
jgi:hypothetical protein